MRRLGAGSTFQAPLVFDQPFEVPPPSAVVPIPWRYGWFVVRFSRPNPLVPERVRDR